MSALQIETTRFAGILLLAALLAAGPAWADDEEESEESEEGEDAEEAAAPAAPAAAEGEREDRDDGDEDGDDGDDEDDDDGDDGDDGDDDDGDDGDDDDPAAREPARKAAAEGFEAHRARFDRAPWFSLYFGGHRTQILDPDWLLLYQAPTGPLGRPDDQDLHRFTVGLDVYPHPNIGVSVAGATHEPMVHFSDAPMEADLEFHTRVASLEFAAKGVLAPAFLPVRPFVRGGAGFVTARVVVRDPDSDNNLASREFEGSTGYVVVGGGVEITTPRQLPARDGKARAPVRFGFGVLIEGGAMLGGGGTVDAAPGVELGQLGSLDLGPGYMRVAALLMF